ncbi:hypothetical protein Poli38472_004656 [Pythium oligandrum]|uniref:Aquaporin n=1 Tax=Pythium oligandrum TaxID=41045 RepID=A0A8K1CAH8_PYTOL|nr:hypothetical protein Poli38472_004656 [Pythium oligandrum]|eukprot:TMW59587.1 hypothetical protein Poli38472_004656 [Pythium oligandrum]
MVAKHSNSFSEASDTRGLTLDIIDSCKNIEVSYSEYPEIQETIKPKRSRFATNNPHMRECLAEFFGTFIMICFGFGVNNQVVLSKDKNGTWLSVNMCWGIAVMLGVHCSEGVSGAHLNPAVTVTMATYKRLPWRKVPGYIIAQLLGAFAGAVVIYILYHPWFDVVDPDRLTTQGNFATYPSEHISNATAFYTEFLATAMLIVGVFCITDKKNRPASPFNTPLHFMFLIWAIGMAFGMNTGYAINPARDFAPRLFTSMAGWGSKVFTLRDHYFWIPVVAPCVGGVFGGGLYKLFVEIHHPIEKEVEDESEC